MAVADRLNIDHPGKDIFIVKEVVTEIAGKDPIARKIYDSYSKFKKQVLPWTAVSEQAYLKARDL